MSRSQQISISFSPNPVRQQSSYAPNKDGRDKHGDDVVNGITWSCDVVLQLTSENKSPGV